MTEEEEIELLRRFNRTELYQTAREAQLNPEMGMTRDDLIALLLGHADPPATSRADLTRYALAAFVDDHWATVQSIIECPAKDHHPKTCFACEDQQVLACLIDNPRADDFVVLRVPNRP